MNELIKMLSNSPKFNSYIEDFKKTKSPVMLTGLTDVMKMYFAYITFMQTNTKLCIITYNEIQARSLVKNLEFFTDRVTFIPKKEIVTYDYVAESKDLPYERIEALNKLQQNKVDIVVTTIEALMQSVIKKDSLYKCVINFKVGNSYSLEQIKQDLVTLGYTRCDLIEARGQFSLRGGILDVALNENKGIRIEFWGDEVDSIRYFNISSQRSTGMCKEITICPAHEYILEKPIQEIVNKIENTYDAENYECVKQDIEQIENGGYIS
jgi:transcription-repair coupling factor (superfamily II helicase)